MRISELIGSQVISLSGAKVCGVVCGVRLSENLARVKAAEIFMSDEDDCERKFVEMRRIRSVGADTVMIMNENSLAAALPDLPRSPINLPAYSESGEPLGRITDMIVDDKFAIVSLCTAEGVFPAGSILSRSDELVVFRTPGSRTRVSSGKARIPVPARKESGGVKILSAAPPSPGRYGFLLGKRPTSDVADTSGNRIAYAGDIVTCAVIENAKRRGAIVRLAESCRAVNP